MTALQTASIKPNKESKGSAHLDPDGKAIVDRLLTPAEAARWLNCSPSQVYSLIRRRDLPAVHVGTLVRLRPSDLRIYMGAGAGTKEDEPGASDPGGDERERMLFLQSTKGATLSVLLALAGAGRYLGHHEVQLWTHYGHSQVTQALHWLTRAGWAWARTPRGPWRLVSGRHLPSAFTGICANALEALNGGSDSLRGGQSPTQQSSGPSDPFGAQ